MFAEFKDPIFIIGAIIVISILFSYISKDK